MNVLFPLSLSSGSLVCSILVILFVSSSTLGLLDHYTSITKRTLISNFVKFTFQFYSLGKSIITQPYLLFSLFFLLYAFTSGEIFMVAICSAVRNIFLIRLLYYIFFTTLYILFVFKNDVWMLFCLINYFIAIFLYF